MTLYEYFLYYHYPSINLRDNGDKDANDIKNNCLFHGTICPIDKDTSDLTDDEIYAVFASLENGIHQPNAVVERARQKLNEISSVNE